MYSDFYGLTGQPFQLTPDARFWFESRTHRKAMAYLGYGLAQGEGFIVITGEIGAGKTTLVGHLMDRIDATRLNAIRLVSTQVEADDMLRLVAQGLELDTGKVEKAVLLDGVEQRLEEEFHRGKRTLLIVDEAQNLSLSALEELRMLSNFQLGGRSLVQIFLLAQPEFRDKLADPRLEQLKQRVIATHHLDAMGADEIEAYVRHRLTISGWQGRPGFGPGLFDALYAFSGGIPRRLNQLANRLLLHGAVEQLEQLDGEAVEAVAADLAMEREKPAPAPVPAWAAPQPVQEEAEAPEQPEALEEPEEPEEPTQVEEPQPAAASGASAEQLAAIEARLIEQEESLRRMLTLLIGWLESENAQVADRRAGVDRRSNAA